MTEKQVRHYLNEETGKIESEEIDTPVVSTKSIQKISDSLRSVYDDVPTEYIVIVSPIPLLRSGTGRK